MMLLSTKPGATTSGDATCADGVEPSRPARPTRPSLTELGRRCQKMGHKQLGTWMARRVSRPLALRITWIIAPWGISAHAATLTAWAVGLLAALAFCLGDRWSWLLAAGLWQFWYLLDHVDGQLARWHRTESLDGAQLDYWMHHVVHLTLPCGLGYGLFAQSQQPLWLFLGFAWGVALLVVGLESDTRAKTFVLRLKRLSGELRVVGGGGGRPQPAARPPKSLVKLATWLIRKSLELHVLMSAVSVLAIIQLLSGDQQLICGRVFVAVLSPLSVFAAGVLVSQSLRKESAEREFAAWFRLPPGAELLFQEGWWVVQRDDSGQSDQPGKLPPARCQQTS